MASTKSAPRMNRTGISVAPEEALKTAQGAQEAGFDSPGDAQALAELRAKYISEGEPIGSRPPAKGVPDIFLDKLGDRLAFERNGTRLYEAMLAKVRAGAKGPGPSEDEIQHLLEEEHEHFEMVRQCIEQLGGDPTFETPCANVSGVASLGIAQVLSDPRTTVPQCLDALLTAELTDNAAWEMLMELAQSVGQADMAQQFQTALDEEREHLEKVRGWIKAGVMAEAGARR